MTAPFLLPNKHYLLDADHVIKIETPKKKPGEFIFFIVTMEYNGKIFGWEFDYKYSDPCDEYYDKSKTITENKQIAYDAAMQDSKELMKFVTNITKINNQ